MKATGGYSSSWLRECASLLVGKEARCNGCTIDTPTKLRNNLAVGTRLYRGCIRRPFSNEKEGTDEKTVVFHPLSYVWCGCWKALRHAIRRPTPRTTLSPEAFSGRSHRKKMNPVSVKPTPYKDAESVSLRRS